MARRSCSPRCCRSLQVGTLGVFRGRAEVAEADIAGLFEGDRPRAPLGVLDGADERKISHGQIVIEAGGRVSGEMIGLQPPAGTALPAAVDPRPGEDAPQGDSSAAAAPAEAGLQEPPASVRLSLTADDRP
ncbi:MAG: polymer-forming cytoskeletal protein [Rhodospirillales bacterium]